MYGIFKKKLHRSSQIFWATFFSVKVIRIDLDKNGLGYILGDFLRN
jgi:hypothetical protein